MHSLHHDKHLHALLKITLVSSCIPVQSYASSPEQEHML